MQARSIPQSLRETTNEIENYSPKKVTAQVDNNGRAVLLTGADNTDRFEFRWESLYDTDPYPSQVVLATYDNMNEPIIVRQVNSCAKTGLNEAYTETSWNYDYRFPYHEFQLLDKNGNSQHTGSMTLNGNINVKSNIQLHGVNTIQCIKQYSSGRSWYRAYSNGWIEQGGYFAHYTDYVSTVTLLLPYNNTDYHILSISETNRNYGSTSTCAHWFPFKTNKTTSSFQLQTCNHFSGYYWETKGFGPINSFFS